MTRKALFYLCVFQVLLPLAYGRSEVYVDPIANNCTDFNCTRDASALLVQNLTLDGALAAITSNSILHLRPGCHCIQDFSFVQNHTDIILVGDGPRSKVNITCAPGLGLAFYNLLNFTIEKVTVDGCGLTGSNLSTFRHTMENATDLFFHIHSDYHIALLCGNCTDFYVKSVTITNTLGLGLLGINIMGTSVVLDSIFSLNAPRVTILPLGNLNVSRDDIVGGGAIFLYLDYLDDITFYDSVARLSFKNSSFAGNMYPGFASIVGLLFQFSETVRDIGYILGGGGGLSVIKTQLNYSVSVLAESCTFRENKARFGGGAHVEIFAGVSDSSVTFSDCLFEGNGELVTEVESILGTSSGAGLAFFKDFVKPDYDQTFRSDYVQRAPNNVVLMHTMFRQNKAFTGGAVVVESRYSPVVKRDSDVLLFQSCTFEGNAAFLGAVLFAQDQRQSGTEPGLYYMLDNTTVRGNRVYVNNSVQIQSLDLSSSSSIIDTTAVNLTLKDSCFADNSGTVIRTVTSIVHLEGEVTFANNTGTFGGALRLLSASFLIIRNNSNVTFQNNSAEVAGGAIFSYYLNNLPNVAYFDCFMFFGGLDLLCLGNINCVNISKTGARLNFVDNTAPLGGAVYGSTLETCPWGAEIMVANNYTNISLFEILYKDYHNVFNFDREPNTIEEVSTDSNKVRVVNRLPGPVNITPGEEFHVKVVTLDRFSRVIQSILSSKVGDKYVHKNFTSTLGLSGYWFTASDSLTPVTVFGDGNSENVTITLFTTDSYAQADIVVNLLNCSDGFLFSNYSCVCDPKVQSLRYVSCNSSSKELTTDNDYWIGYGPHGELVTSQCLQDFCDPGPKTFRPPEFDSQCNSAYSRTGIACRACKDGYSIVFGTNQCLRCNYSGLYWIPVLGVVGIAIIFVICYLRITITDGYLLSVLFYANYVSLYTPSFSTGLHVLLSNMFIPTAWLNLNLGITSCFYDGMDAVASTALQFVFPGYLYLLMFIIILLARRSHRFTIVFSRGGFSAAKLFATLMLMTHMSITRTCLEILGLAELSTLSKQLEVRWKTDPNVPYFSPARIPLVIIAVLLLLFYIIPAPFLLIFPNYCGRKLKIFQKLMPIYDAFWAPFKPRYRFWVGLRLLLSGIPLSLAFFLTHPANVVLLAVFLLFFMYVQLMVWPFKSTMLNAVDLFLQYNLLTLLMLGLYFTVYINNVSGETVNTFANYQSASFAIIVFIAYTVMVGIFIWHVFVRFPRLKVMVKTIWKKLQSTLRLKSKSGSISVSFSHGSSGQMYGATTRGSSVNGSGADGEDSHVNLNDGDEESNSAIRIVQFSELREPLLEEGEPNCLAKISLR